MQNTDVRKNESPLVAIVTTSTSKCRDEQAGAGVPGFLHPENKLTAAAPGHDLQQHIYPVENVMNDATEVQDYLKSLTVLLVEDNESTRELCTVFLSRIAGVVLTAQNGANGLDVWRQHAPDIIITDICMPVMDGLAMLQEIRSDGSEIPVIILSAFEEPEYLKRCIDLGVSRYVLKPLNAARFTEALLKCARGLLVDDKLRQAQVYSENIVESLRESLLVLDAGLKIVTANTSFYETFKVTPEETIGNFLYDLGNQQWNIPKLRLLLEEILTRNTVFNDYEVEHDFQYVGHKNIILNARQIFRKDIGSQIILLALEDVTQRKLAEKALKERERELGCLYSIIGMSNAPNLSLDELLQMTVALIPAAFQFPDISGACIEVNGKFFQTARFRETSWMLGCKIMTQEKQAGKVTVCYLEERTFLPEEHLLVEAIANKLSLIVMRELAKETIARIAMTDELTGLNNRRSFNESFSRELSAARRHGKPLAVISIDLDSFKMVNDTFGHLIGDLVLKEFSALLKIMLRIEDIA